MKVYAIKDTKVGFMQPFVQSNDAVAVREFTNIVNVGNNLVSANYQDMELYSLGTYNQDNGEIVPSVDFIVKGADVKKVVNNEV